ncbi:MAG: flagellar hook-associated protein FlgK, partial [Thiobacillus sp.]|nr:flagellar hook-associated protein FlgK [Thiobacillus sp.]
MTTTNILSISLSGLSAAQAGMRTTQNNIANVNTAGYQRQAVNFSNSSLSYAGLGTMGNGVNVDGVASIYDRFLENEVLLSQGQLSRYQSYATYAGQVDGLLGDSYTGLSQSLSDFFAAANEVANDPTAVAARQMLLSSGEALSTRVNNLDATLEGMQTSLDSQMGSLADQINNLAGKVADLNRQIGIAEGGSGQTASDLRNLRDQTVSEINKLVNVTPFTAQDGTFSLYIGSGQPLVVGNTASTMTTVADPNDPQRRVPALEVNGVQIPLDTKLITGGQLGGILAFREDVLNPAQQDIARLASGFAMTFNALHRAGYDQDGNAGQDFFANPAEPQGTTTASIELSLVDDRALVPGNYRLDYDGSNYTLTDRLDGSVIGTYGSLAALNADLATRGFQIDAAPAGTGTWNINFDDYPRQMAVALTGVRQVAAAATAAGAPGDNSNALALAALQTDKAMNGGTSTFQTYYGQIVSRVASQANSADASQTAYEVLTTQATQAAES